MSINECMMMNERIVRILNGLPEDSVIISVSISEDSSYILIRKSCGLEATYSMPSGLKHGGNTYCKTTIDGVNVFWFEDRENA